MQTSSIPVTTSDFNLTRFLTVAEKAGQEVMQGRLDSLAELILDDSLGDDARRKLGFATEMLARAKRAGQLPSDIWQSIQYAMGAEGDKPLALQDMGDVELGVLAFGSGVCAEDMMVRDSIGQYVDAVLRGRALQGSA